MSTSRSVKVSVIAMGVLTALILSLILPQLSQVAHAAKGGQADYQAQIDTLQTQINAQQAQINTLTTQLNAESIKLADVTADPLTGDILITGVNLHVRSGSGDTSGPVNGAGNLIIGYNEHAIGTGSHNLVVGETHTYTSYGGIVFGLQNSITAPYACVSGGLGNAASGLFSCVSGGQLNLASGQSSSVTGGVDNVASGYASAVSGGLDNTAALDYAVVP